MKNKNLIIGLGVAVVVYYLYNKNQKKKIQSTPYTDAELDKVVADYVNKEIKNAKILNPNATPDAQGAEKGILDMIKKASSNGKDVSRANVDKILVIYSKWTRNMGGDTKSLGMVTPEEMTILNSFQCQIQPSDAEMKEGYRKWRECKDKYKIGGMIDPSKMTKEEIIQATLENEKSAQKYGELCNSYLPKPRC
jgi:hypothetical protein